ncbi:MAG: TfoX/Sxy family protein [Clostridiales bacterium]|nr:TfoX/Sxy family protein [Clostridiales bacterium]
MRNIGKEIERKLKSIGIETAEELKNVGIEEVFVRLKLHYPSVCLVHLYALEGAISDAEYNQLPEDVKQRLKIFYDKLQTGSKGQ